MAVDIPKSIEGLPTSEAKHIGRSVNRVEDPALLLIKQRGQAIRINSRNGDMGARAVYEQGKEHKQQAAAKLGEPLLYPCQLSLIGNHQPSTLPPAPSMALRAPLVTATSAPIFTVTARAISPEQKIRTR